MSVTILPYIDDQTTQALREATQSKAPATMEEVKENFQDFLDNATQAQKAMAVDALLAVSSSGAVSTDTVQQLLGFNPLDATSISSTVSDTSTDTSTTASDTEADTATAAASTSTAGTASTGSSSSSSSSSSALSCSSELEGYFKEASEKYDVDENLLKAVAKVESAFTPSATSSAGAMGVMQLMPSTAKALGVSDAYDARENILGGAKLLSQLLEKYNGDTSLALAAYNAGSGNVDKCGGVPSYTQSYINKVMSYL
jgi:soluble lytic murein transglycosylase-like protein